MKCIHELESGCTYCGGKDTTAIEPKAIKVAKKRKPKAPVSPEMVRARLIAKGEMCEHCLSSTGIKLVKRPSGELGINHVGRGCDCSRQGEYHVRIPLTVKWLKDNRDAFKKPGAEDEARAIRSADMIVTGLAFSTQTRASRRAGIVRDAAFNGGAYCSEQDDERIALLKAFNVDPKWHAARNQEADKLPV